MSIYNLPSRFNFQCRPLVGNSFIYYVTSTYLGHERLRQSVCHDQHDANYMLRLTVRAHARLVRK